MLQKKKKKKKREASTIKINRRLKTEANRPRHKKNSNTGNSLLPPTKASPAPFVSTMYLGSVFTTGKVSILSPGKTRRKTVHFHTRTRDRVKQMPGNGRKKEGNITLSHNRFILPLSNNYNPLSLFVVFG